MAGKMQQRAPFVIFPLFCFTTRRSIQAGFTGNKSYKYLQILHRLLFVQ